MRIPLLEGMVANSAFAERGPRVETSVLLNVPNTQAGSDPLDPKLSLGHQRRGCHPESDNALGASIP